MKFFLLTMCEKQRSDFFYDVTEPVSELVVKHFEHSSVLRNVVARSSLTIPRV